MQHTQFGERQYETAANNELSIGVASPFVPTQNVEFYLGIDAAHGPQNAHSIWRILSVNIPRRVKLTPMLWPRLPRRFHDELPGRFVSLFVQYKVAKFQDAKRAKYYARLSGPYFETSITSHQQKALERLEQRVNGQAVVRYAAPAFWSRTDFDLHDTRKEVLQHSAFTSPSLVAKHRKWFFTPTRDKMLFNPDPEEASGQSWPELVRLLAENTSGVSLREHVRRLAEALGAVVRLADSQGENDWILRLRRYGDFTAESIEFLLALRTVAIAAELANVDWIVLVEPAGWKYTPDSNDWHFPWWY
jgi:hypothetical protein